MSKRFFAHVDPFEDVDAMVYALQEGEVNEVFQDKFDELMAIVVNKAVDDIEQAEQGRRQAEFLEYVRARLADIYEAMETVEKKVQKF